MREGNGHGFITHLTFHDYHHTTITLAPLHRKYDYLHDCVIFDVYRGVEFFLR